MKRKISLGLVCVMLMCVLSGCGNEWKTKYEDLSVQYNNLRNAYSVAVASNAGVGGIPTYDGTFDYGEAGWVFPQNFGYPGSTGALPGMTVTCGGGVCTCTVTQGWATTCESNVIYLYNPGLGVSGCIRVGDHSASTLTTGEKVVVDAAALKTYLAAYIGDAGTGVKYRDIYLGTTANPGVGADCSVLVDGSDTAQVRVGLVGDSTSDITYVFIYHGAVDSAVDQAILSLLGSVTLSNKKLEV